MTEKYSAPSGEIILISVKYEKDFRKQKCNLFDQSELSISILISIKELLLTILKCTLELKKGQALQTFLIGIRIQKLWQK